MDTGKTHSGNDGVGSRGVVRLPLLHQFIFVVLWLATSIPVVLTLIRSGSGEPSFLFRWGLTSAPSCRNMAFWVEIRA